MNHSELILQEVSRCPAVDGATMADILALSDPLRLTLKEMVRHGPLSLVQVAEKLDVDMNIANRCVELLMEKGYLTEAYAGEAAETLYRLALAPLRGRPIPDDL